MTSPEMVRLLLLSTLATSAAAALVLALRGAVRRRLGASAAYLLWLCVPAAWLAVMLPAPRQEVAAMTQSVAVTVGNLVPDSAGANIIDWPGLLLLIWLCGSVVMLVRLWRQQRRFMAGLGPLQALADGTWQATAVAGLPAAIGLLRPRVVLPAGFAQRYSPQEQALVLHHERIHIRRGDLQVNAAVALLCCLYWFNPLLLLTLRRCREDQELSCDERVIAANGDARRSYGMAMLKTELALSPLPVGCHWQNHHPLKERIAMLKRPVPGRQQWIAMALLSLGVSSSLGYTAWAAQPAAMTARQGEVYAIKLQLNVDGERQQFEIREHVGRPFAFSFNSRVGKAWSGEFVIATADRQRMRVSGDLKADGVLVSSPNLLIASGMPAGIKVSTPDGASVLDMVLDVQPSASAETAEQAVSGRTNVEPEPMPASVPTFAQMAPPRYPPSLNTGEVVLMIDVAATGAVTGVTVARSSGFQDLDAAAMEAARKWKLNPGYEKGRAVAGQVRVPVRFEADETEVTTVRQDGPR